MWTFAHSVEEALAAISYGDNGRAVWAVCCNLGSLVIWARGARPEFLWSMINDQQSMIN
jgi:hypothetical protein